MKEIPFTQFEPDDQTTWPPHMNQCIATWLEKGKPRFSACAAFGFGGWYDIQKAKNGQVKARAPITFDPHSLGWCLLTPPFWWKKLSEGGTDK